MSNLVLRSVGVAAGKLRRAPSPAIPNWNLEPLEPRRLMSISFDNGVLTIKGTAGDDVIQAGSTSSGYLYVYDNEGPYQFEGGLTRLPALAQVKGVRIEGGDGNDMIAINRDFALSVTLVGGAGDDTLIGGAAADVIYGGAGEDTLYAQALYSYDVFNHSRLHGRVIGDDTICGEGRGDVMDGQGPDDAFHGEPRDDMSLTFHNGVLRIRGTPAGNHLHLFALDNPSLNQAGIVSILFDRGWDRGWSATKLARDVNSVELLGIAPNSVTIEDSFTALGIPVRYVTQWSQNPPLDQSGDHAVQLAEYQAIGGPVQAQAFPERLPAYPFGAASIESLLGSWSTLWG
jgi:hypothetical protein